MLTEATYWLEEQIPAIEPRMALLQGNNGFGEEMWRDGRILALSDGELAQVGDPALDWSFSQGLLRLHDQNDTPNHCAEASGFVIVPEVLGWATVWIRVKAPGTTNGGLRPFIDGIDTRAAQASLGMSVVRSIEAWVASALGRE